MKFKLYLLVVLLSVSFSSVAQPSTKELANYIEKARALYGVPGMAVAIVKDGEIFMSQGFGVKSLGGKDKVDENTLFAIASNTKAFVASALAILIDKGKLSWDDPVKQYLPYFELYDPYVSDDIRIRDLLCHRAGLGTYSGDAIWYKSELPAEEVVKLAKHVPQAFPFRGGYGYTNLMFITAGEVIKAVTGQSWDEYVKQQFFSPLGMDRTITSTNELKEKGNYATPHKTYLDQNTAIEWTNWDNMGAAGGIISSVDDMASWMILNLNSGILGSDTLLDPGEQNILWTLHNNYVLSKASKERMPGRHFAGYGLGWGLQDYYGRLMVSHGGGYDGMYSRVSMMPDENLGIVVLTNSMSGISGNLINYIYNQFIEEDKRDWVEENYRPQQPFRGIKELKEARQEGTSSTLKLSKYAGDYFANMYGDISVKLENDKLRLYFSHSPGLSATLSHWHYDTWQIEWDEVHAWFDFGLVTFELNDALQVVGMNINVPNNDIFFHEFDIVRKE